MFWSLDFLVIIPVSQRIHEPTNYDLPYSCSGHYSIVTSNDYSNDKHETQGKPETKREGKQKIDKNTPHHLTDSSIPSEVSGWDKWIYYIQVYIYIYIYLLSTYKAFRVATGVQNYFIAWLRYWQACEQWFHAQAGKPRPTLSRVRARPPMVLILCRACCCVPVGRCYCRRWPSPHRSLVGTFYLVFVRVAAVVRLCDVRTGYRWRHRLRPNAAFFVSPRPPGWQAAIPVGTALACSLANRCWPLPSSLNLAAMALPRELMFGAGGLGVGVTLPPVASRPVASGLLRQSIYSPTGQVSKG